MIAVVVLAPLPFGAVTVRGRMSLEIAACVLGIRVLRPFPEAAVAEVLKDKRRVLVLERTDAPLASEPPLTREVRAALAKVPAGRRSRPPHRAWLPPRNVGTQLPRWASGKYFRCRRTEHATQGTPVIHLRHFCRIGFRWAAADATVPVGYRKTAVIRP